MTALYASVRFGRGQGLGNRLFPWARARVFCEAHGVRMIAPTWARLAVGPALRGGVDLRDYRGRFMLHGVFRPRQDDVGWVRGLALHVRGTATPEPLDLTAPFDAAGVAGRPTLVAFAGYRRFFEPVADWPEYLGRELRRIVHPLHRGPVERIPDVPVALHVRCGPDFPEAVARGRLAAGEATPVSWFVSMLRLLRQVAGRDVTAWVVSDGGPARLAPLTSEPNVVHFRGGSAMTDLLLLARARVLLASGSSSFSAWGAFLGQMGAATHPGQPLVEWRLRARRGQFLGEVDPGDPPTAFLEDARERLRGAR